MNRLRRFARYLRGVVDFGVFIPRAGAYDILECYIDADWAGDTIDRKSISCGAIQCGGATLFEYARGQSIQALSSAESEYYAGVTCTAEGLHIKAVMGFLEGRCR